LARIRRGVPVSCLLRFVVLSLVLAVVASPPARAADAPAAPSAPVRFETFGRVLRVINPTTVVVNRGRAEGLTREAKDLSIYPRRKDPKTGQYSFGYPVRLARARVESLEEHSARLKLFLVTDPVREGDPLGYHLDVTEAQRDDPLLEVALLDVEVRTLDDEAPIYRLGEIRELPLEAWRPRVLDALVAEIHARADIAGEVYTQRLEGGRFHGKTLSEAFAATGPAEVLAFFEFVREFPGKYMCDTWKLVEVYGTWIVNGSPAEIRKSLERRVKPLMEQGDKAAEEGRFADAEAAFRRGLELLPDDKPLSERLEAMTNVRVWSAMLEKDPDDTALRWKLMVAYFNQGAFADATRELDKLEAAGYQPEQVLKYRGLVACRQERFDEGLRILARVLARGPDKDASEQRVSCQQLKQLKARPGSVRALIARAEQQASLGYWGAAQTRYWSALDAAKTKAEIEQIRIGQRRVALLEDLEELEARTKGLIERHELPFARKLVTRLLEQCDQAGKPGLVEERLARLASTAYDVFEVELALELRREQLRRAPKDLAAHQALAWLLLWRGELAATTAELKVAQALGPDAPYTHYMWARVHLEEGRLAEARTSAERALADKKYAWPRQFMAQFSASGGRYEEAVRWAKEAHALRPDESEVKDTLLAALRAEEAARAISQGRDVARNRLRLVRALVAMTLGEAARREADALMGTPHHEEAKWAIASSESSLVRLPLKAAAADAVRAETPARARIVGLVRARLALRERPDEAAARVTLARALVDTGAFHEALAVLGPLLVDEKSQEFAARDVAELARRGLRALELHTVSGQASSREDYKTAERYAAQAQELLESVGYKYLVFHMARWRASLLSDQGRYADALSLLRPILEAARAEGDPLTLHDMEVGVARLESNNGSLDSMSQALARGRSLCEELDDEVCLARIHKDLGLLELNTGRLNIARQELERALQLAQRTGQQRLERETLGSLSDTARMMSEPKRSRELAEELLLRSRKAVDPGNERFALMLLGALDIKQGDAARARARFEEVYRLGQRTGDTATRAQARLWDGNAALLASHDPRAALGSYEQAVVLYGGLGDEMHQAEALKGVGEARAALGELVQAREALASVIELARARKRLVMEGEAQSELALVEVQRGQAGAALAAANEAVRIADASDMPEARWLAHYALARALDASGKQAEASTQYETAVAELGRVMGSAGEGEGDRERLLSYGRRRQVFEDAIEHYLRLGQTERALELLQLSHDSRLRQMFDSNRLKVRDGQLQETLQQIGDAESRARAAQQQISEEYSKSPELRSDARIAALSQVVASTKKEMLRQLQALKSEHGQLYGLLAIDPQSISDVRNALPEGTLVVVYFIASDSLYAFLITRGQDRAQVVKVSVPPAQVEEAVFAYHDALVQQSKEVSVLAERLHGWLIAPIEAEMARAKTTLVVPFGPLYYLPFHALSTPDASGRPVYVLEKHRLGYLSSTTFFKMMDPERKVRTNTLLGFANPDGTLFRARQELQRITSESYPDARVLYGQEATNERYFELAGGYDIIHFATHGVLSKNALASHLKMARGPLSVDDIVQFSDLEGKTGLVVLSACETALEHGNRAGDEFISLARAFGAAGAPSILASLWKVDDKATSELMATFYSQLRKSPQVDTLEALRQAQLHVLRLTEKDGRRLYQHPGYWAPFTLIGDFR
jgi:CHAT domain-containing protein